MSNEGSAIFRIPNENTTSYSHYNASAGELLFAQPVLEMGMWPIDDPRRVLPTSVFRPQAYCTSEKYCTLHSPHNGQMFGRLHLCCKYQRHTHLRCRRAIAETTCKLLTRGICQPTEELSLHCRKHFTERTLQYSTVGLSLRREVCRSLPTKTQGLRFQFSLDCFADIGLTVDPKDTLPPPAAWVKQKVPALITRLKTYQEAIN